MLDAIGVILILDAHAHPNIFMPWEFPSKLDESLRSLRQDLKRMPVGSSHHIKNTAYEIQGHVRMEKIAHRIDKDLPRMSPPQRLIKHIWL
jgi:hypothetical protein